MQVIPNKKKYKNEHKDPHERYYKLLKKGKLTSVHQITGVKDEIKPLYQELWNELEFAYDHDKPVFMWNVMRRILESFVTFIDNGESIADIEHKMDNIEDKALALGLVKGLHVNSHIGIDTDMEIDGYDKDDLHNMFTELFTSIGFEQHFSKYCKIKK